MSTFNNIQNALSAKLATISGLPTIYYPNQEDLPAQGSNFIAPTLLPANSDLFTLNNENMHKGIYQIDIYTQREEGTSQALLLADLIRDGFKRQNLVSSGTYVHIQQISISPAKRVESWWYCHVDVNYICVA